MAAFVVPRGPRSLFFWHGLDSPAMALELSSTELPDAASDAMEVASVLATKKSGRPKKGSRPKIDIDDEIDEANRLAEVTKKMMQAAKAAQRNSRRTKQRLVRKAGKLSPADLERIATLKRCGLFVADPAEPSSSSSSAAASHSSSSTAASSEPIRRINTKLFSAVGQVQGAADLLATMQQHVPVVSSPVASGSAEALSGEGAVGSLPMVPRGHRLGPAGSSALVAAIPAVPLSAEAAPGSPIVSEQVSTGDHVGEDAS